jgi:hypothetical protein
MRTGALVVIALLALPEVSYSQRLPRPGRGAQPEPAPLPPQAPEVNRALALKRSHWSAEGYSMLSTIQVPNLGGGTINYSTFGAGTHAAYRVTNRVSGTMDLTLSTVDGGGLTETAEVGTRYETVPWDRGVSAFFDVRAAFMHMYDSFAFPVAATDPAGSSNAFAQAQRYSRGFGGIGGAGLEVPLTRSLALTTELAAMRNRMSTYHLGGAVGLPTPESYWMTSFRFVLGFSYSPRSALQMVQKSTP